MTRPSAYDRRLWVPLFRFWTLAIPWITKTFGTGIGPGLTLTRQTRLMDLQEGCVDVARKAEAIDNKLTNNVASWDGKFGHPEYALNADAC